MTRIKLMLIVLAVFVALMGIFAGTVLAGDNSDNKATVQTCQGPCADKANCPGQCVNSGNCQGNCAECPNSATCANCPNKSLGAAAGAVGKGCGGGGCAGAGAGGCGMMNR